MHASISSRVDGGNALTVARGLTVARILLADNDPASRLTLRSILTSAGYAVDCAARFSEARERLDRAEYQLVLADLGREAGDAGSQLLSYARQKEFRPATALMTSEMSAVEPGAGFEDGAEGSVAVMSDEDLSYLLGRVAELIGQRAARRAQAHRC